MMIARMFIMFFGMTLGWILGSVFASEIIAPYLKYWGLKIRMKLARKIQEEVVILKPGEYRRA